MSLYFTNKVGFSRPVEVEVVTLVTLSSQAVDVIDDIVKLGL